MDAFLSYPCSRWCAIPNTVVRISLPLHYRSAGKEAIFECIAVSPLYARIHSSCIWTFRTLGWTPLGVPYSQRNRHPHVSVQKRLVARARRRVVMDVRPFDFGTPIITRVTVWPARTGRAVTVHGVGAIPSANEGVRHIFRTWVFVAVHTPGRRFLTESQRHGESGRENDGLRTMPARSGSGARSGRTRRAHGCKPAFKTTRVRSDLHNIYPPFVRSLCVSVPP